MDYNLQIQKLLIKKNRINSPTDRTALLKEAVKIADAHNDLEWGFELRLDLIREEKDTSGCEESFTAFTWILDTYDSNPDMFDESDFLWEYKWMIGSARRNGSISLEQIDLITEDYKKRLLRNGYALRPYYSAKTHMGFFLGDLDAARHFIELRDKELRDDQSNCHACELDDNVELELRSGNFEKALIVGNDMLTKKVTCAHMPFSSYCACTKYFNEAGQTEKAKEFFDKAEADFLKLEDDNSMISELADMIRFLTDYDKEKAWRYFEQYAHWNVGSEEYLDFLFSINVLPLLSEGGTKHLNMNPAVPWFNPSGDYETAEIFDFYYKSAETLARKFDKRNGSSLFVDQLNATVKSLNK